MKIFTDLQSHKNQQNGNNYRLHNFDIVYTTPFECIVMLMKKLTISITMLDAPIKKTSDISLA
jgi:hypothetical protein